MTTVLQPRGPPVKARVHYAMEDAVIVSGDTDLVLPPLEAGTVRRVNSSNVLEQNRYEKYRVQLQKEKEEAKLRFYCRKQDFLRSSIVIQERNIRSSKRKHRLKSESAKQQERFTAEKLGPKKDDELIYHDHSTRNTRENSINSDFNAPLMPPYFLPPLYKNIILGAKELNERRAKQDGAWQLNIMTVNDVKNCRYLRIAGRAKLLFDLQEKAVTV